MRPMLDPKRDLKGATPETLARALLRRRRVPPSHQPPRDAGDTAETEPAAARQRD